MKDTPQDNSLIAAIEGDFAGMAHSDLVLTCKMLTNGRAQWRKEAEELQAALDSARQRIAAARGLLLPLGNQPVPSVLAIREALNILR